MGYSFARRINRVGAEIGGVTVECRSDFRICAATGIVGGEERTVIPHDMGRHVALGVIKQLAEHLFSQWKLKLTLRIARFKRDQSPCAQQARSGMCHVWRRDHRTDTT